MKTLNTVYCDVVAGELIYFFHDKNKIANDLLQRIKQNDHPHVKIVSSMVDKLSYLGLKQANYFPYQLYLLQVPEGSEILKINWLFNEYQLMVSEFILRAFEQGNERDIEEAKYYIKTGPEEAASSYGVNIFHVIPNGYHSLNSRKTVSHTQGFSFTKTHDAYKEMMHFERMQQVNSFREVLIIDSGIEKDTQLNIVRQVDFVSAYDIEDSRSSRGVRINNLLGQAMDETGHGTAVANMIHDICPKVPLIIYKIVKNVNGFGLATEWDLIAALIAKNDAKIINISLSYGLPKIDCGNCGRLSTSTRSYIMEYVLFHTYYDGGKIVIVSGGNAGMDKLNFPARFDYTLGVISLNSSLQKSGFSNSGTTNFWGDKHPNVIAAPGGEEGTEHIFFSPYGINGWGTSFAAAYVTALVTYVWSRCPLISENDSAFILGCLKNMYVDKKFLDFNEETFGNGKIVIHEKSNEKFDLEVGERRKHMNGLHNETMDRLHGGDIGME